MTENALVTQQFAEISRLLAQNRWKEVILRFDEAQQEFSNLWSGICGEFANKPQDAPIAAKKLLSSQPLATSLTLATARSDSIEVFPRLKRFVEFISKQTERMPGYPAVVGIPHVQAGFLYMTSVAMALHWESWNVFESLLTTKFEWYYQSGRPIFSYGFDLPYFFHSEALGREASRTHDFFRKELAEPRIADATGLTGESLLDTYVQAQMLLSLRVAQLREAGETASIWPDFGRFYAERVVRLLDRVYADREYARCLLRPFKEDADTFFSHLNERLGIMQSVFWGGSRYFYESLRSWEPKGTPA